MTSRSLLDITAETVVSLAPLPLPLPVAGSEPDAAAPALQLFVARAREASPSFALTDANTAAVIEICRRLQGLPLALELAAARVRSLGPETMTWILRRPSGSLDLLQGGADDAPDRHRTIRQTLRWSCSLLNPAAAVFRQLGVFPASFSLEGAEAVADDTAGSALAGLDTLVCSSLVLYLPTDDGGSRYDLLQPVRELAREQLEATGKREATTGQLIAWARDFTQERRVPEPADRGVRPAWRPARQQPGRRVAPPAPATGSEVGRESAWGRATRPGAAGRGSASGFGD